MTTVQRVVLIIGAVAVIVAVATAPQVEVTNDGLLTILANGQAIVAFPVDQLKATWQETLADDKA